MKLNTDKTEYCLFTRNPDHMKMKDKVLKNTNKVKVLGVILDSKMTFQHYMDMVQRKAANALGQLMVIGRTKQIIPE